jgi:predicted nucleotidyltransferase component of viral defense system
MIVSKETLLKEAGASGFRPEILEKVLHLLRLLDAIRRHPYLKERLVLKGGTALNLFEFDVPRLSVDIDLNYIGAVDVEVMKAERPKVEQSLFDVCNRSELTVERRAKEHAGGKWQLRYASALGGGANLQVDINFMLRLPLWPIVLRNSKKIGSFQTQQIPLLDINELAAAKLAALLARHAARDLFDAHQLLTQVKLDDAKLRLAFLVYGGMNIEDWRKVSVEHVDFDPEELKQNLIPVLRGEALTRFEDGREWSQRLVRETRENLSRVLPFTSGESQFLEALLERAEIVPEHLTGNAAMIANIKDQPMLHWKALNVRKFKKLLI